MNICDDHHNLHICQIWQFPNHDKNFWKVSPPPQSQEIELKRASPSERLGMTLCYEDEDAEGNTEIFIDDIAPEGLAARDGRLRLGDQIIQINGVKVKTKAKAQEMFLTITGDVSLLVVRPPVLGGAGYEEVSVGKEAGM